MRVLIVGVSSSRSIGYEIAAACRSASVTPILTSRREKFIQILERDGFQTVPFDYPSSMDAISEVGEIDGLVFCISHANPEALGRGLVGSSREHLIATVDTGSIALVEIISRLGGQLKNPSSVVALTFMGARVVVPGYSALGIAKAALEQIVRTLSFELGPRGIRVNAVSAGCIRTASARVLPGFNGISEQLAKRSAKGRAPSSAEVADAVVWLLDQRSVGITGEVIEVSGGASHVAANV